MSHPQVGPIRLVGPPIRLEGTPARPERVPPCLGEHTAEILGELGYDDAAIERLRGAGAFGIETPTDG
jgi:formyl-CoA transferase